MGGRTGLATGARVVLGLIFVVFGVNGFLNFLPTPAPPPAAAAFAGALFQTGYFFPLMKSVEIVAGLMLLSGRFVPLALVLLAPIIVNIVAFHVFLAPDPVMPILVTVPELYLAWVWREAFKPLFTKASPHVSASPLRGSEGALRSARA